MAKPLRCSQAVFYQACRWLETHRTEIGEKSLSAEALVKLAKAQLNIDLSESSIRTALDAVGIRLTRKHKVSQLNGGRQARERQIAACRNAIINIYEKLGEKLPEKFLEETAPFQPPKTLQEPDSNGNGIFGGDKVGSMVRNR